MFLLLACVSFLFSCGNPLGTERRESRTYEVVANIRGGSVAISPQQSFYAYGDTVAITASPMREGSVFSGWSGTYVASAETLSVVVRSSIYLSAEYGQYELTFDAGGGFVSIHPEKEYYVSGDTVILYPHTTEKSTFVAWEIDSLVRITPLELIMDSDRQVRAHFTSRHILHTEASTGGRVVQEPDEWIYTQGDTVRVTAHADSGYVFLGWSGARKSEEETLYLSMDRSKHLMAHFGIPREELHLLHLDYAGGIVLSVPRKNVYRTGDTVTLFAIDVGAYRFSHWEGAVVGDESPASFVITSDTTVSAHFTEQYSLDAQASTGGRVFLDPAKETYMRGDTVTLTAHPDDGWVFVGWDGMDHMTTSPVEIVMTEDQSIRAEFRRVPPRMAFLSGGTFLRGGSQYFDEMPARSVTLSSFYMGKYPLTQKEYLRHMPENPARKQGDSYPQESVSWYDAARYCNMVSVAHGFSPLYDTLSWEIDYGSVGIRLPTEAEWEYALGTDEKGEWFWGSDTTASVVGEYAVYAHNSRELGRNHPQYGVQEVGQKNRRPLDSTIWRAMYGSGVMTGMIPNIMP
ncbi:hypothetical protein CALK_2420 [Chitinivibrio alkaliphilus ACht1]|uniref:Sulfatase-modifying factor enzyme domain-containing protein n=1 Tax=Chitinivibrio alkaliphilus ACht1 TaxID=1313304 RepID=U7D466_9BACT|nr:hypothetical protein CALK_2420 [Chitinivibrio alkaliphilus ACht1]